MKRLSSSLPDHGVGLKLTLVFLFVLAQFLVAALDAKQKPNIIFILADDLGYGDLSCLGQKHFKTPNIDALAERGMLFTQHYSGSAVCAPSRAALLTGQHTGHTWVRGNAELQPEGQQPMPADTFTVAHMLQTAGYKTGVFGKWGLGGPGTASEPLKMGFDRFYGYNCQRIAHSYYPAFLWNDDERELLWGNVASHTEDYAPDLIHEQALSFIRDNKEGPFFMYYAAIQPHADMDAPERYMDQFRGKYEPETEYPMAYYKGQKTPRAAFAAMVSVLDDYVGELMAELEAQGVSENTLVFFSSDNGPHVEGGHDPDFFESNGPLSGYKRDLYEGGVRTPMIAVWPAQIEAGSRSEHISAFWDFLPTVADLSGQRAPKNTDGLSMLPTLLGEAGQEQHKYLYWEFHAKKGRVAMRMGKWKAVRYNVSVDPHSPLELYDLSVDVAEQKNVAAKHPEVVAEVNRLIAGAREESPNPNYNFPKNRKK
ncbi:arylsulfatase [Pelagicoccus mobilis]|uniref:Arylsulfatase n=1 Tax=Pelagicoccus mobilis TaxID=415221 RepID=A0A934RS01_9BACT|nr:arylsulfatase [Pelagicoccus mobilis]MBK1875323.1 arylsulfatase [Pelagicoccus mobilis]